MQCQNCDRPIEQMRVLSSHPTSDGLVRYRACVCGVVAVEMLGARTLTSSAGVRPRNPVAPSTTSA